MKVTLVNSPCSHDQALADNWYLPLGLVHIGALLRVKGFDVEILDGLRLGPVDLAERLEAELVGITFTSFDTASVDEIARLAKKRHAFVVLGGHAASSMPELLLRNNRDIDAVVVGDGEDALLMLIGALKGQGQLTDVPNLVYRSGGHIVRNVTREVLLSSLPMPRRDTGGLDPEQYIRDFTVTVSDPIGEACRATNVVTRRGCPRRASGHGCSFCARIDKSVRSRTPLQAWQEYHYLARELRVNYLYEDSDSWINVKWLTELADIWDREGGLDVRFRVYGDVRDISPQSVALLRRLNVDTVLMGIESGDRNVLVRNGKDFSRSEVERACELLADAEIKIADAYVLGLAGESWESIDRTIRLSESVRAICPISATYWNIMLPLPGAPAWNMLIESSPRYADFASTYRLDMDAIREEFFTHCTNLGTGALQRLQSLRTDLCQRCSMLVGEYIR